MIWVLLISAAILGWTWVGYPVAAWLSAQLRARPVTARPRLFRGVTVIVVARDEEDYLRAKLASLRRGGIPRERLEILVVDDGSVDDTAAVAAAAGARTVVLANAGGKARALDSAARRAKHDLLIFTDARQPIEEGALASLVEPFADPSVGAVAGEISGAATGAGAIYRRLDDALRRWESASGSSVGVAGALWACRKNLYPRVPRGILLDDLYAPLMVVRAGRRVVIAPQARVVERVEATTPEVERRRRIRTLAGNFQLIARAPWLLVPFVNPLFYRFVSHKVSRLLGPLALAAATVAIGVLAARGGVYAVLAVLTALAYLAAAAGARLGLAGRLARSFVSAQGLVVLGLYHALRGSTPWRPPVAGAPRAVELGAAEVSHGL